MSGRCFKDAYQYPLFVTCPFGEKKTLFDIRFNTKYICCEDKKARLFEVNIIIT